MKTALTAVNVPQQSKWAKRCWFARKWDAASRIAWSSYSAAATDRYTQWLWLLEAEPPTTNINRPAFKYRLLLLFLLVSLLRHYLYRVIMFYRTPGWIRTCDKAGVIQGFRFRLIPDCASCALISGMISGFRTYSFAAHYRRPPTTSLLTIDFWRLQMKATSGTLWSKSSSFLSFMEFTCHCECLVRTSASFFVIFIYKNKPVSRFIKCLRFVLRLPVS